MYFFVSHRTSALSLTFWGLLRGISDPEGKSETNKSAAVVILTIQIDEQLVYFLTFLKFFLRRTNRLPHGFGVNRFLNVKRLVNLRKRHFYFI